MKKIIYLLSFVVFLTMIIKLSKEPSEYMTQVNFETTLSKEIIEINEILKVEFVVNQAVDSFKPPSFEGFKIIGELKPQLKTNSITYTYLLSPLSLGIVKIGQAKIEINNKKHNSESIEVCVYSENDILNNIVESSLFVWKGVQNSDNNNYLNAVSNFNTALLLVPISSDAYYNRGVAKFALKQYSEAISDYTMAIKYNFIFAKIIENYKGEELIKVESQTLEKAYNNRAIAKYISGKDGCSDLMKAQQLGFNVNLDAKKSICKTTTNENKKSKYITTKDESVYPEFYIDKPKDWFEVSVGTLEENARLLVNKKNEESFILNYTSKESKILNFYSKFNPKKHFGFSPTINVALVRNSNNWVIDDFQNQTTLFTNLMKSSLDSFSLIKTEYVKINNNNNKAFLIHSNFVSHISEEVIRSWIYMFFISNDYYIQLSFSDTENDNSEETFKKALESVKY
jgi:tetratricopeptide (TPR) repeat protein